jgi:outer membrane protein assembly factor BamB
MKLPLFICALAFITPPASANWPQFRGPGGLGIGTGTPPLEVGPETNVKWKVEVAQGHSSPCIWEEKIALTALDAGTLFTLCLDKRTGRELWRKSVPAQKVESTHRIGSPASPTPCTDGSRVYAYFGSYGVLAYDWSGREVWSKALPAPVVEFGTGSSPIVVDGKVILVADGDIGGYILALDAVTGAEVWRVDRSEFRRGFSSPFVWRYEGREELVVAGALWVRGYDLKTGKQLWSARGMARVSNATPIAADGLLLVSSWNIGGDEDDRVEMEPFESFALANDADKNGTLSLSEFPSGKVKERFSQMDANKDGLVTREEYEHMRAMFAKAVNQLFAIKPGGRGDITETHVAWRVSKQLPYVSSPVAVQGRVFTMKNGGLASCYETLSGAPVYQGERVDAPGDYYSSAVAVGNRIYITSQKGVMTVLDTSGESLKIVSRNELQGAVFASPAIVDGVIYLRTDKHLFAFGK